MLQAEDLNALVARDTDRPADYAGARIKRYELTGRQVLVYVEGLNEGLPLTFHYRMLRAIPSWPRRLPPVSTTTTTPT